MRHLERRQPECKEREALSTSMRLRPRVTASADLGVVTTTSSWAMREGEWGRVVALGRSCEPSTPVDYELAVCNDELARYC